MKISIFDMRFVDEKILSGLVQQTLSTFPILKEIYDDEFVQNLTCNHFHFNNYLLWLLSSKEPFTSLSWMEIAKSLSLLDECNAVGHFRGKLKSTEEYAFKSYQIELDYAAYYKERGYSVDLEPILNDSGKNPEFMIELDGQRVYFEAKNIFWEEMMKEQAVTTQIHGVLGSVKQPYVFSVFFSPELSIADVTPFKRLFVDALEKIGPKQVFPLRIQYQPKGILLAEIVIHGKPNKLPYGYLGGFQRFDAFMLPKPEVIRRKISKKVPQLPENEANVIVIEPGDVGLDKDTMVDVLYGDELVFFEKDFSAKAFRKRNGFYQHNMNTRISAVIFSRKRFKEEDSSFIRWKSVFHNPFAKKALDRSLFDDKNAEQFVPTKTGEAIKMEWR